VRRLDDAPSGTLVPLPLFWQHMPAASRFEGTPLDPEEPLIWRVTGSLKVHHAACNPG
jgi:D-tagatose-1,6-bisphosphate aldolase subunit GatZ/KbaZ